MVENASASPMAPSLTGVTAGDQLILVSYISGVGGAQPSVSSVTQAGVTWLQICEYDWVPEGSALDIWWCPSALSGTNTPSIVFSSSGGVGTTANAAYLSEWSGIGSAQTFGIGTVTTSSATILGPSLTASVDGALYFMGAGQFSSATCSVSASSTPTSGWTNVTAGSGGGGPQLFGSGDNFFPVGYQVLPDTNADDLQYTVAAATASASVAALFLPPSGGPHWYPQEPGWGATL